MTATLVSATADGARNRVIFTETDALGVTRGPFVEWRPFDENVATFLALWDTGFTQSLADAEAANDVAQIAQLGSLAVPTFQYTTAGIVRALLRAAYQVASQVQAIMIGDFLNTLTDAQLQAAFGLTSAQVTSLRTNKLAPAASAAATIRATTGA